MILRKQQHAPDNFSGRDTLGAWDGAILAEGLRTLINVAAINNTRVITVHDIVDVMLLDYPTQIFFGHDVWNTRHHFVDPFAALDHGVALSFTHEWWTLGIRDRLVIIHTHNKVCAHQAALSKGIGMTIVHHIERTIHPYADLD